MRIQSTGLRYLTDGKHDHQLVEFTSKRGLFLRQARYCVERKDRDLWKRVLSEENEHRRSLIDQVVATALPLSRKPDEVSSTAKAFMNAELPHELIEVLERMVLGGAGPAEPAAAESKEQPRGAGPDEGTFGNNQSLQTLLIRMAKMCVSDTHKLYEEGLLILKKFKCGAEAIHVLLYDLKDMQRAQEFAADFDEPKVWSKLGRCQLDSDQVQESIESFLKARDAQHYRDVMSAADKCDKAEMYAGYVEYLKMVPSTEFAEYCGADPDRFQRM